MMLGRKKKKNSQSNGEFLASIKSYYEDEIVRKRLSTHFNVSPKSNVSKEHDLDLSLSQLNFEDVEKSTYDDLMSRLSKKPITPKSTVPNICNIPTPITKSPVLSNRQPTKHSISGQQPISTNATNQAPTFTALRGSNTAQMASKMPNPVNFPNNGLNSGKLSLSPAKIDFKSQPIQQAALPNTGLGNLTPISTKSNVSSQSSPLNLTPIPIISKPTNSTQPPTSIFSNPKPLFSTPSFSQQNVKPTIFEEKNTSSNKDQVDSLNFGSLLATSPKPIDSISRQRRPSKSETPESSKFSYWVKSVMKSHEEYLSKLEEFKQNLAVIPLCNKVRMAIQEIIDIHTVDDANDISSISAALIFFQDLYRTGAHKKGEQPLPLTPDGRLFITMSICERYLKRVIGQDTCISFVATLFIVLSKNEPTLFNVLLSMVLSKCVLPRLDTNQCLDQILKISEGPAEESAQWISEENSQFKLLVKICTLTTNRNNDPTSGLNLIQFLLNEALRAPAIPISTPFVINAILSTDMTGYQKKFPSEFAGTLKKSKEICELDWPTIIRTTLDATELRFPNRALTLTIAKNSALIQGLKSTLSTF